MSLRQVSGHNVFITQNAEFPIGVEGSKLGVARLSFGYLSDRVKTDIRFLVC